MSLFIRKGFYLWIFRYKSYQVTSLESLDTAPLKPGTYEITIIVVFGSERLKQLQWSLAVKVFIIMDLSALTYVKILKMVLAKWHQTKLLRRILVRVYTVCPGLSGHSWSIEPPHDKTNKMTCAPSEDAGQLGLSLSLIRVFFVHSMGS